MKEEKKEEKTKPSLSELKKEEISQRMHTIVVFGIPQQMSLATLENKYFSFSVGIMTVD